MIAPPTTPSLANHLRLFYTYAGYSLIRSLRENSLRHTELAKVQR